MVYLTRVAEANAVIYRVHQHRHQSHLFDLPFLQHHHLSLYAHQLIENEWFDVIPHHRYAAQQFCVVCYVVNPHHHNPENVALCDVYFDVVLLHQYQILAPVPILQLNKQDVVRVHLCEEVFAVLA